MALCRSSHFVSDGHSQHDLLPIECFCRTVSGINVSVPAARSVQPSLVPFLVWPMGFCKTRALRARRLRVARTSSKLKRRYFPIRTDGISSRRAAYSTLVSGTPSRSPNCLEVSSRRSGPPAGGGVGDSSAPATSATSKVSRSNMSQRPSGNGTAIRSDIDDFLLLRGT